MEIQAGADRYAVTVLFYLTAVTIYGVSQKPAKVSGDANRGTDSDTRGVEARAIRSVGPFAPGLPCADGHWTDGAFFRLFQSL